MTEGGDLLDGIARRFEDDAQSPEELPQASGWGQFLDAPKRHEQTGPYGTCAALMVLSLAERGRSALLTQAQSLLEHWWQLYRAGEDESSKRFVQTLRLAILNLALHLSAPISPVSTVDEVRHALLDRVLPSGLWGDYWISETLHDQSPRLFPSAVALLSFTLFRDPSAQLERRLVTVADNLEAKLRSSDNLTPLEIASIACAVLSVKGVSIDRRASSRIVRLARPISVGHSARFEYFYDFEYSPDSEGRTQFGRDYFIVPRELLLGICGFQRGAPSELRLRAEAIIRTVADNMRNNNGVYRADVGDRVSSLDQGWTALFLKASMLHHDPTGVLDRVRYELFRERADTWLTGVLVPVCSMLLVTAASVFLEDSGPVHRAYAALAALIVGSVYGAQTIRKLISGRR